jgi:TonB family protein
MGNLNDDINKYLRGELSSSEMHALEKKALSDPFLADALEGAGLIPHGEFSDDIKKLSVALKEKVSDKKVIPLWLKVSRIAAIFVTIAVATFLIRNRINQKENSTQQALNEPRSEEPIPLKQADSVTAREPGPLAKMDTKSPAMTPDVKNEQPSTRSSEKIINGAEKEVRDAETEKKDNDESKESVEAYSEGQPSAAGVAEDDLDSAPSEAKPAPSVSYQLNDSLLKGKVAGMEARRAEGLVKSKALLRPANRVIRGQVLDVDDGKGVPGVNVIIKGSNTGTVTNSEGFYEISTESNTNLVFSFIGYESQEIDPGGNNEVNVVLNQDVSELSEIVVVGYGSNRDGTAEEKFSTFEMAAPAGGRKAFKQYLEQNIRYPEQALNNEVEGKVTIQFTVESSGNLSEFKVIRGVGFGCDEELIRLIKEGPKWTATKRDASPLRDRVKVRLKFSLPKK